MFVAMIIPDWEWCYWGSCSWWNHC